MKAGCEAAKEMQRVYKRHQTDGEKECSFSDAVVTVGSLYDWRLEEYLEKYNMNF